MSVMDAKLNSAVVLFLRFIPMFFMTLDDEG
jgi:hypothetical protein